MNEERENIVVIAERPEELVAAQNALCDNIGTKIQSARGEVTEAEELLNIVRNAGFSDTTAKRSYDRTVSRVEFLCKVQEALAAGYVIVPDMPSEVIAIRVKRSPSRAAVWSRGYKEITGKSQSLPVGEGDYVAAKVPAEHGRDEEREFQQSFAIPTGEWEKNVGLPLMFLKPKVVQRTGDAMAQKIFDEIAITPTPATKSAMNEVDPQPVGAAAPDPMVIGRVVDRATKKRLCFLVAWFVDTKMI